MAYNWAINNYLNINNFITSSSSLFILVVYFPQTKQSYPIISSKGALNDTTQLASFALLSSNSFRKLDFVIKGGYPGKNPLVEPQVGKVVDVV